MKVIEILQERHKTQFNVEKMANMVKNYGSFGLKLDDGNYAVFLKNESVIAPILERQELEDEIEVRVLMLNAYSWEDYAEEIAKDFLNAECEIKKIANVEELKKLGKRK